VIKYCAIFNNTVYYTLTCLYLFKFLLYIPGHKVSTDIGCAVSEVAGAE